MNRRKKIKNWILIITIFCIIINGVGYLYISYRTKAVIQASLEHDLNIALAAINPASVESIAKSLNEETEDFLFLRNQLWNLQAQFKTDGIDSIYTMTRNNGKILFLVDSIPIEDPKYGPPGDVYLNPPSELSASFLAAAPAFAGPYTNEYGEFYSYFKPIKRLSDNSLIGMLGVDIQTNYYAKQIQEQFMTFSGILFVFYVLLLFLFIYTKKYFFSQQELNTEKKLAEDLINVMPDIFYLLDQDGKLVIWNKAFANIFGLNSHDAVKSSFSSLFAESSKKKVEDGIKAVYDNGQDIFEAEVTAKDGQPILFEFYNALQKNPDGKIVGVAGNGHNITLRHKREIDMAKQREELENINQLMIGREMKMMELKQEIAKLRDTSVNN